MADENTYIDNPLTGIGSSVAALKFTENSSLANKGFRWNLWGSLNSKFGFKQNIIYKIIRNYIEIASDPIITINYQINLNGNSEQISNSTIGQTSANKVTIINTETNGTLITNTLIQIFESAVTQFDTFGVPSLIFISFPSQINSLFKKNINLLVNRNQYTRYKVPIIIPYGVISPKLLYFKSRIENNDIRFSEYNGSSYIINVGPTYLDEISAYCNYITALELNKLNPYINNLYKFNTFNPSGEYYQRLNNRNPSDFSHSDVYLFYIGFNDNYGFNDIKKYFEETAYELTIYNIPEYNNIDQIETPNYTSSTYNQSLDNIINNPVFNEILFSRSYIDIETGKKVEGKGTSANFIGPRVIMITIPTFMNSLQSRLKQTGLGATVSLDVLKKIYNTNDNITTDNMHIYIRSINTDSDEITSDSVIINKLLDPSFSIFIPLITGGFNEFTRKSIMQTQTFDTRLTGLKLIKPYDITSLSIINKINDTIINSTSNINQDLVFNILENQEKFDYDQIVSADGIVNSTILTLLGEYAKINMETIEGQALDGTSTSRIPSGENIYNNAGKDKFNYTELAVTKGLTDNTGGKIEDSLIFSEIIKHSYKSDNLLNFEEETDMFIENDNWINTDGTIQAFGSMSYQYGFSRNTSYCLFELSGTPIGTQPYSWVAKFKHTEYSTNSTNPVFLSSDIDLVHNTIYKINNDPNYTNFQYRYLNKYFNSLLESYTNTSYNILDTKNSLNLYYFYGNTNTNNTVNQNELKYYWPLLTVDISSETHAENMVGFNLFESYEYNTIYKDINDYIPEDQKSHYFKEIFISNSYDISSTTLNTDLSSAILDLSLISLDYIIYRNSELDLEKYADILNQDISIIEQRISDNYLTFSYNKTELETFIDIARTKTTYIYDYYIKFEMNTIIALIENNISEANISEANQRYNDLYKTYIRSDQYPSAEVYLDESYEKEETMEDIIIDISNDSTPRTDIKFFTEMIRYIKDKLTWQKDLQVFYLYGTNIIENSLAFNYPISLIQPTNKILNEDFTINQFQELSSLKLSNYDPSLNYKFYMITNNIRTDDNDPDYAISKEYKSFNIYNFENIKNINNRIINDISNNIYRILNIDYSNNRIAIAELEDVFNNIYNKTINIKNKVDLSLNQAIIDFSQGILTSNYDNLTYNKLENIYYTNLYAKPVFQEYINLYPNIKIDTYPSTTNIYQISNNNLIYNINITQYFILQFKLRIYNIIHTSAGILQIGLSGEDAYPGFKRISGFVTGQGQGLSHHYVAYYRYNNIEINIKIPYEKNTLEKYIEEQTDYQIEISLKNNEFSVKIDKITETGNINTFSATTDLLDENDISLVSINGYYPLYISAHNNSVKGKVSDIQYTSINNELFIDELINTIDKRSDIDFLRKNISYLENHAIPIYRDMLSHAYYFYATDSCSNQIGFNYPIYLDQTIKSGIPHTYTDFSFSKYALIDPSLNISFYMFKNYSEYPDISMIGNWIDPQDGISYESLNIFLINSIKSNIEDMSSQIVSLPNIINSIQIQENSIILNNTVLTDTQEYISYLSIILNTIKTNVNNITVNNTTSTNSDLDSINSLLDQAIIEFSNNNYSNSNDNLNSAVNAIFSETPDISSNFSEDLNSIPIPELIIGEGPEWIDISYNNSLYNIKTKESYYLTFNLYINDISIALDTTEQYNILELSDDDNNYKLPSIDLIINNSLNIITYQIQVHYIAGSGINDITLTKDLLSNKEYEITFIISNNKYNLYLDRQNNYSTTIIVPPIDNIMTLYIGKGNINILPNIAKTRFIKYSGSNPVKPIYGATPDWHEDWYTPMNNNYLYRVDIYKNFIIKFNIKILHSSISENNFLWITSGIQTISLPRIGLKSNPDYEYGNQLENIYIVYQSNYQGNYYQYLDISNINLNHNTKYYFKIIFNEDLISINIKDSSELFNKNYEISTNSNHRYPNNYFIEDGRPYMWHSGYNMTASLIQIQNVEYLEYPEKRNISIQESLENFHKKIQNNKNINYLYEGAQWLKEISDSQTSIEASYDVDFLIYQIQRFGITWINTNDPQNKFTFDINTTKWELIDIDISNLLISEHFRNKILPIHFSKYDIENGSITINNNSISNHPEDTDTYTVMVNSEMSTTILRSGFTLNKPITVTEPADLSTNTIYILTSFNLQYNTEIIYNTDIQQINSCTFHLKGIHNFDISINDISYNYDCSLDIQHISSDTIKISLNNIENIEPGSLIDLSLNWYNNSYSLSDISINNTPISFQGEISINPKTYFDEINITNWGNIVLDNDGYQFKDFSGTISDTSGINLFYDYTLLTGISGEVYTSLSGCFENCTMNNSSFNNLRLNEWNIEYVNNLSGCFKNASNFNIDISNWRTENVTSMAGMFQDTNFNHPIDTWKDSSYTYWNVQNVNYFNSMFRNNSFFDQLLNGWNTDSAVNMRSMFEDATEFDNSGINMTTWNTSSVLYMDNMFKGASKFKRDITDFEITEVISMDYMFKNSGITTDKYTDLLYWFHRKVHGASFSLSFHNLDITTTPSNDIFDGNNDLRNVIWDTPCGYYNMLSINFIRNQLKNVYDWSLNDYGAEDFSAQFIFEMPANEWRDYVEYSYNWSNLSIVHPNFHNYTLNQSQNIQDTRYLDLTTGYVKPYPITTDTVHDLYGAIHSGDYDRMNNYNRFSFRWPIQISKCASSHWTNPGPDERSIFQFKPSFEIIDTRTGDPSFSWPEISNGSRNYNILNFINQNVSHPFDENDPWRHNYYKARITIDASYDRYRVHWSGISMSSYMGILPAHKPAKDILVNDIEIGGRTYKNWRKSSNITITQWGGLPIAGGGTDYGSYYQSACFASMNIKITATDSPRFYAIDDAPNKGQRGNFTGSMFCLINYNDFSWDFLKYFNLKGVNRAGGMFNNSTITTNLNNKLNFKYVLYCDKLFAGSNFNNGYGNGIPGTFYINQFTNTLMDSLFEQCEEFNQYVGDWKVEQVTHFDTMFYKCVNYNQPIDKWQLTSAYSMGAAFWDCKKFNSTFNIGSKSEKLFWICDIFMGCTNFNQNLNNNWDVKQAGWALRAFKDCENFNNGDVQGGSSNPLNWKLGENFNPGKRYHTWNNYRFNPVQMWNNSTQWELSAEQGHVYQLFENCKSLNQYLGEISDNDEPIPWDMKHVGRFYKMFEGCTRFNNGGRPLYLNTKRGYDFHRMFYNCTSLNVEISLNILGEWYGGTNLNPDSSYNSWNNLNMYSNMFWNNTYHETSNRLNNMFDGCTSLNVQNYKNIILHFHSQIKHYHDMSTDANFYTGYGTNLANVKHAAYYVDAYKDVSWNAPLKWNDISNTDASYAYMELHTTYRWEFNDPSL